jgi:hypothetical protein
MTPQLFFVVYLGLWAAIAAAFIYFGSLFGVAWWQSILAAFLMFFVVNGSLAYAYTKRRLEAAGERPPPYLVYLFFPRGFRSPAAPIPKSIAFPRILRIVVGAPIFLSGAIFAAFAVSFGVIGQTLASAVAIVVLFETLGLFFMYVGFRLVVMRGDESLFKRPWQEAKG